MNSKFQFSELEEAVQDAVNGSRGDDALRLLERETSVLGEAFKADPFAAVTGDLLGAARLIEDHAIALALEFRRRDDTRRESQAWCLRCSPLLIAYTHHRHVIGPAMIEWADCLRRNGETSKADSIYESIIRDFQEILGWGPTTNESWLTAVKSLQKALENSTGEHTSLSKRTTRVLVEAALMTLNPGP